VIKQFILESIIKRIVVSYKKRRPRKTGVWRKWKRLWNWYDF